MTLRTFKGVPSIVSQSFPNEVWRIGEEVITVDMGSVGHVDLVNAAKSKSVIEVELRIKHRPVQGYFER